VAVGQSKATELPQQADSAAQANSRFDEIFLAVATLFEHQKGAFADHERHLAADILKRLSKDVEMAIRIRLAERLADDAHAPHDLILLLADDRIEVARLILARSPVLTDSDLARLVEHGSDDHQAAIADRPAIGESVSAALAKYACENALILLLRNKTARIGPLAFEYIGERARELHRLQEPLVERADLPPELAQRLYIWVSAALKTALAARYPAAAQSLRTAVEEASTPLKADAPECGSANAKKLVDKLKASGQLRASFLIRVLHQGQMELFEEGFAALLGMKVETMRKALYGENPQTVALACRAAGIDRSVFQTVFNLSRHHRRVVAELSDTDKSQIGAIFSQVPKTEALDRLRTQAA